MMSQHSMSRYNPKRRPSKRRPSRRALRTLVALAVVAFLAAVPAVAQGGPGPGHGHHGGGHHAFGAAEAGFAHGLPGRHMGRLVRFLDLTADQKESAKALFESTRAEVEPIREAQRERHQELRTLLQADSPDAAEVGALVIAIHASRDEVKAIHDAAFAEFKDLLTSEQLAKLERFQEERGDRPHRRHGARRGPGGGGPAGS